MKGGALLGILLAVSACPSSGSEPAATGSAAPPARSAKPPTPAVVDASPSSVPTGPLGIRWSNIVTTEGCFFFSGPDGRDEQLVGEVRVATAELEGTMLRVRVGTALFEGTYSAGALDLVRDSTHQFNGAWKVHETLRGRHIDGELRVTYRYEECEVGAQACPGRCTISADMTIRR